MVAVQLEVGLQPGFGGIPSDVVFGGIGASAVLLPFLPFVLTSASGYEASQEVALPAGSVITRAAFTVAASAPPFATPVGDIAVVRAAAGAPAAASSALAIDFGVLRTVSSVAAP